MTVRRRASKDTRNVMTDDNTIDDNMTTSLQQKDLQEYSK
jgi:hypothetical protein